MKSGKREGKEGDEKGKKRGGEISPPRSFLKVGAYAAETIIKPPPPVGAGGGYMFSGRPSVHASVCASVPP